jgi:hypothetical protein
MEQIKGTVTSKTQDKIKFNQQQTHYLEARQLEHQI